PACGKCTHLRAVRGDVARELRLHSPEPGIALRLGPEQHGFALLADGGLRRRARQGAGPCAAQQEQSKDGGEKQAWLGHGQGRSWTGGYATSLAAGAEWTPCGPVHILSPTIVPGRRRAALPRGKEEGPRPRAPHSRP